MAYELKEVIRIMQVFHCVENEIEKFLSISGYAMKNKEFKEKSAQSTLKAIEEYKKLPIELRRALENDKRTQVSKIIELKKLCRDAVAKGKSL